MRLIHFPSWGLAWNSVKRTSSRITSSPRNRVRSYGPHVQRVRCSTSTISAAFQPLRRNTMQPWHCLSKILLSVLVLCSASAGLPLLSVAQESYRTQMSFRKPFLTPSTASRETPSARPGHAKPFMGWRKAAQDGPATLQYFKELANSHHAKSLRAPIWSSLGPAASALNV